MIKADQKTKLELILTQEEAQAVLNQGDEAVVFKLLELSKRIQELEKQNPSKNSSTPSGQVPVYQKPSTSKSKKKPGRKKGHKGSRRPLPPKIDRHETHSLKSCPHCGNQDLKVTRKRKRVIEDIKDTEPESVSAIA